MFKHGEFGKLLELVAAEQPVRMLEIGCHIGRTACHVRPGGLIIWHDYGNPGADVTVVLEGRDIRTVDDTWLAMERV